MITDRKEELLHYTPCNKALDHISTNSFLCWEVYCQHNICGDIIAHRLFKLGFDMNFA